MRAVRRVSVSSLRGGESTVYRVDCGRLRSAVDGRLLGRPVYPVDSVDSDPMRHKCLPGRLVDQW